MIEDNKAIYDEIIDNLHLTERTGKSREQLYHIIHKSLLLLNMSYVMADVIDQMLQDMESELRRIQVPYNDPAANYLKELKKLIGASRKWAYHICREMYHNNNEADMFVGESDFWFNLILLVADRTGEDELKTKQLINWIDNMPSVLNMFNISYKDFLTPKNDEQG